MDRIYNILIADQNPYIRKFLRRELAQPGYRIFETGNPHQLYTRLYDEKDRPHLIVLDPYIPYVNGVEMLKRLQNIAPPVPVILYTYITEYRHHPLVENLSAFVEKDGDTGILLQTIADVLHSHYAAQVAPEQHQ